MARDYAREYARRQERARESGWTSYGQRRQAYSVVENSDQLRYYSEHGYIDAENKDEAIKSFYMMRGEGDRDYGRNSWHYHLLVEVLGYVDADDWDDLYPGGVRSYGR